MARATAVDSTEVRTLASGVSIGGSSLTLDTTPSTWQSGAGVYSVQVGEDPDTDAELVNVTRTGTTLTLSGGTLAKAHSAGANVYVIWSAADANDKASAADVTSAISTHDGATTVHAAATNLVHRSGAETIANVKTFSSPVRSTASASLSSPAYAIGSETDTGIGYSAATPYLVDESTGVLYWSTGNVVPTVPLDLSIALQQRSGDKSFSGDIWLTAADKGVVNLFPSTSGLTVYMPTSPVIMGLVNRGSDSVTIAGDIDEAWTINGAADFTLAAGDHSLLQGDSVYVDYRKYV